MNPVIDYDALLTGYTQKVFRSLLESMARPGKINSLQPFPLPFTTEGVSSAPYLLGIACTLLDMEVGFSVVSPDLKGLISDIEFHSNARPVAVYEADYIVMSQRDAPEILLEAKRGNLNFPDQGATVILVVDGMSEDPSQERIMDHSLILEGPGVLNQKVFFLKGIDLSLLRTLQSINAEFPLGLDLILVSRERIACFPRSTTIKLKDE